MINHLFSSDFGDAFRPLSAAGRFEDPAFGPAVELLVTDKASYKDTGMHWRSGGGETRRGARQGSRRLRRGDAGRDRAPLRRGHGRADLRAGASRARPAHIPRDRARLLPPAAGGRPARVPAPPAQPLRRRGARHGARVAVRRGLEQRLSCCGARPRNGRSSAGSRSPSRKVSRSETRSSSAPFASATTGWPSRARSSLERLCERIIAEHDYDLAVLAQWDGRRRYANLRKLARLARSYEELRGPDVEGSSASSAEQDTVGASELEAVAEEEGAT